MAAGHGRVAWSHESIPQRSDVRSSRSINLLGWPFDRGGDFRVERPHSWHSTAGDERSGGGEGGRRAINDGGLKACVDRAQFIYWRTCGAADRLPVDGRGPIDQRGGQCFCCHGHAISKPIPVSLPNVRDQRAQGPVWGSPAMVAADGHGARVRKRGALGLRLHWLVGQFVTTQALCLAVGDI